MDMARGPYRGRLPPRGARVDPGSGGRHPLGMFGIGLPEVLIILLLVVVIFGARRLPEVGAGLGKAIKNFKSGVSGKDEIDVTPKKEEVSEGKGRP